MAASGADNPTRREQPKTMSTTLSNNTFGTAMAGNDTVGARPRRHPVITKMFVSGAIALGVWVGVAATRTRSAPTRTSSAPWAVAANRQLHLAVALGRKR